MTITPALSETVADMALTLMLATARNIPQAHIYVKNRLWRQRADRGTFMGVDFFSKTLGIVGLGRIGSIVAKRGKGFDMKVIYYDAIRNRQLEEEHVVEYRPLNQLLAEADFISIHTLLTEETRGLIGEKELKTMSPISRPQRKVDCSCRTRCLHRRTD